MTKAYEKFPHAIANNGQHSSTSVLSCAKVLQAPYKELLQLKELPMRNACTYTTHDCFLVQILHPPSLSIRIYVIDNCIFQSRIYTVKVTPGQALLQEKITLLVLGSRRWSRKENAGSLIDWQPQRQLFHDVRCIQLLSGAETHPP